ncbi:ATP-binding cassette domain-containing protein [Nocardioides sp. BSK12Z-3]|nr:oligopeptide/dipeptide ABC transporter ATP-binding protein [Nocardioides bruguierae]MCL8025324.1 ATP-binding cassette domain-containing protein [Nocardioides bruguierae]
MDGVTLDVLRGECLGLVGESGCGKSTVARVLTGLYEPTGGSTSFEGHDLSGMRGSQIRRFRRDTQMVFQDPYGSLNPRWRIRSIVEEPLRAHHVGDRASRERAVAEAIEMVGLDPARTLDRFPHEFSGGQRQRISIARAIVMKPKLVVADEAVSALDVSVQAQILNLLMDLQRDLNLTYVFIAHGLDVVRHVSNRVGVMYLGKLVEIAEVEDLYERPAHPYSRALLASSPVADPRARGNEPALQGELPSPMNPPSGCRFRTRCPRATERCATDEPALLQIGTRRSVACHYPLLDEQDPERGDHA